MTLLIILCVCLGALLLFSLGGWGLTIVKVTDAFATLVLRSAQAFEMEERVSAKIDDRTSRVINRYRELRSMNKTEAERQQTINDDETEAQKERRRQGLSMTSTLPPMEGEIEAMLGEEPLEE